MGRMADAAWGQEHRARQDDRTCRDSVALGRRRMNLGESRSVPTCPRGKFSQKPAGPTIILYWTLRGKLITSSATTLTIPFPQSLIVQTRGNPGHSNKPIWWHSTPSRGPATRSKNPDYQLLP